jgi:SAM-dependent methyltransferase
MTIPRPTFVSCCLAALLGVNCQAQTQARERTQAAPAAGPTQEPYQPTVGQAGKDVVWVPTSDALVEKMLDLAGLTPQDYLMDLGSGDGRTVIAAAKRGARARGIEFNGDLVELSRRKAREAGVAMRATFVQADIFETDLSQATVITMFLLPSLNLKLRPTLLGLRPGTRLVSNSFSMEDWEPDDRASVSGECGSWCSALFWVVPAKVEGEWQTPSGPLRLQQKFQNIFGTLGDAPIAFGRLRGAAIEFEVAGTKYSGQVSGSSMQGLAIVSDSKRAWNARRVD